MSDLLDAQAAADFKAAIKNVTDTFHQYPVTLERDAQADTELLAGLKVITNELKEKEGGAEIDEAYSVTFNREYLLEQSLVDANDNLLFGYDDSLKINGKRFHIVSLRETAIFRSDRLIVVLEVVR